MCRLFGLAAESEPEVLVKKRPVAPYEDEAFAREAQERESPVFVAHVRYASTGKQALVNTHPFEQEGRSRGRPPTGAPAAARGRRPEAAAAHTAGP
jgi:predicted glutamine amidotransferase